MAGDELADEPEKTPHPVVNPAGSGHCRVCGIDVVPRNRQYCDEHRPATTKAKAAARRRRPRPQAARPQAVPSDAAGINRLIDEAERILDDMQTRAAVQLSMIAPVAGGYWADRMEANTRALLTIAAGRPKLLTSILKLAEGEAYWDLATFAAGMVVAAGVEAGFVDGEGRLAAGFEITDIYLEVQAARARVGVEVAAQYDVADREPPEPFIDAEPGGLAAEL